MRRRVMFIGIIRQRRRRAASPPLPARRPPAPRCGCPRHCTRCSGCAGSTCAPASRTATCPGRPTRTTGRSRRRPDRLRPGRPAERVLARRRSGVQRRQPDGRHRRRLRRQDGRSRPGTYRSFYGLPACTTANGCFRKVNQSGVQGSYPANNVGWAVEISLDLDMVSAICPKCHILLVEATNNSEHQPLRSRRHRGAARRHRGLEQLRRRRERDRHRVERALQPPRRRDHGELRRRRLRRRSTRRPRRTSPPSAARR